jgi:tyrosine-protein kinase Etk/Wzc
MTTAREEMPVVMATIPTIGLSNILLRLTKYRFLLLFAPLAMAILAGVVAALSLPIFTAYARLLPPQTNTATASTLLNQIGGGASLGSSALTLKNPSDLYASLFLSRSVQDAVIQRFGLAQHYREDDMDQLRQLVAKRTKVDVGRDGIITLSYTDKTSERAADIANGMIDAMYSIARRLAREEALRRQEYYEVLVNEAKARLKSADENLMALEEQTGLTRIKGQEEAAIATATELQGMIATRLVDLTKMRFSATDRHPQVMRMQAEVAALRAELWRVEKDGLTKPEADHRRDTGRVVNENKPFSMPFKDYPKLRMMVEHWRREIELQNTVLDQLVKARALSRVDESRDLSIIQVLDSAVAPTKRSGPRPLLNATVGGIIGLLIAVLIALFWDLLFTSEQRRERWRAVISSFFKWRRKKSADATSTAM